MRSAWMTSMPAREIAIAAGSYGFGHAPERNAEIGVVNQQIHDAAAAARGIFEPGTPRGSGAAAAEQRGPERVRLPRSECGELFVGREESAEHARPSGYGRSVPASRMRASAERASSAIGFSVRRVCRRAGRLWRPGHARRWEGRYRQRQSRGRPELRPANDSRGRRKNRIFRRNCCRGYRRPEERSPVSLRASASTTACRRTFGTVRQALRCVTPMKPRPATAIFTRASQAPVRRATMIVMSSDCGAPAAWAVTALRMASTISVAGKVARLAHRFGEAVGFEFVVGRVGRFGDAVAVDHERVARCERIVVFRSIRWKAECR